MKTEECCGMKIGRDGKCPVWAELAQYRGKSPHPYTVRPLYEALSRCTRSTWDADDDSDVATPTPTATPPTPAQ